MSKKDLILLHGAIGDERQLLPLKAILQQDFNVYTMNFSGHGGRAYKADFNIDTFTNDVLELMDGLGLQNACFFGYSMGGYVVLNLIKQHPERVIKLFTLATKLHWTPDSAARELRNLNPEKIEEKVPKFAEVLKKRHAPNDWKEHLSKTGGLINDLGNGFGLSDKDFEKIQVPVTIGVGTGDVLVSLEESEHVVRLLPNGELKVFEGFKHPIEQIDNEVLCSAMTSFFLD